MKFSCAVKRVGAWSRPRGQIPGLRTSVFSSRETQFLKGRHTTAWRWRFRVHRAQGGAATTHGLDRSYGTTPARDTAGQLATDSVRDRAGSRGGRVQAAGLTPPARWAHSRPQHLPSASRVGLPALPLGSGKHAHRWAPLPPPESDHLCTFCALRPPLPRAWEFAVSERDESHSNYPSTEAFQKHQRTDSPEQLDAPEDHAARASPAPEAAGRVSC